MGKARVAGGVTVRQMCTETDISNIIGSKKRVVEDVESQFAEDLNLRAAITAAEAYEWTARWRDASIRLAQEEGITGNWAPLLDTLHESTDGSSTMQYINTNNTEETRWVSTKDTTFKDFTSYLSTKWEALRKAFTFENGKFKANAAMEGDPIDGLNAMFAVQTIIDCLNRGGSAQSGESINPELSLAIKVHSYVNMVQVAHGSVIDINKVAGLVKTALEAEQLAGEVSLSTFGNIFKSTATEGFGVTLGFVNVGLDAYQLWLARDEIEKATFGTQLVFDLASSVAGVAGVGAGLVGASGVAMALSGGAVILGGLAIGVGALAHNFGKIASDAQEVGKYFAEVYEAYNGGGYNYETNEKALVPLSGAVVTSIKMANDEIEVGFDSQFIYRTHHGPTGSGKINYFFWIGDKPTMVDDRSQAINVREGIGCSEDHVKKSAGGAEYLILPITPKSFISYEWMILPFATLRHDRGFDVIRRLEEDESGEDAKNTTWIIDGSTLGDASIKVGKDLVNVGGITIHVLNQEFSRLLIISPGGEVSLVDFASQQALIQSEDASKWTNENETIQQHLQKLLQENRVSAHFVVVNNYIAEHDGQQRQVGRAYYDVSCDRMLYTDVEVDIGCEFMEVPLGSDGHLGEDHPTGRLYTKVDADQDAVTTHAAFLGAVAGNDAYFFNTQSKALWLVNAETHRITT
ncbi:hypothetical protein KI387_008804, partial [Taxus chinensis]